MSTIEEVTRMEKEGRSTQEIFSALQERGIPENEISEAIAQSQIKTAIKSTMEQEDIPQQGSYDRMQPSMLTQEPSEADESQTPAPTPGAQPAYDPSQSVQPYSQSYSQPSQGYQQEYYPQYQASAGLSSDTINEIAEQVVSEKISSFRHDMEKLMDLKNTITSKVDYIDERLKRIEKVIDRLQLSVLQKVGDYMTNVDDIKKEISETQKSMKVLASRNQSKSHSPAKTDSK